MKHIEQELQLLKDEVSEMWELVQSQINKAKHAFLKKDTSLAREIISREKRVDAFELKIDSDCENYIALYNPVAVDLRLVLSLIKISITLERIADFAEGIARYVIDEDSLLIDSQIIKKLQIEKMFDILLDMLNDTFFALESENVQLAGKIMSRDIEIDRLYLNSFDVLANYLQSNIVNVRSGLKVSLIIRKLERIGDHCNNIVEELVFYIDAKVLRHKNKKEC